MTSIQSYNIYSYQKSYLVSDYCRASFLGLNCFGSQFKGGSVRRYEAPTYLFYVQTPTMKHRCCLNLFCHKSPLSFVHQSCTKKPKPPLKSVCCCPEIKEESITDKYSLIICESIEFYMCSAASHFTASSPIEADTPQPEKSRRHQA